MELELGEGDAGAGPGRQQWWRGDGWEDGPPPGWEDGGATEEEEAAWAAVEEQQQQLQRQRQQQPRAAVKVSVKDLRDGTYACRYVARRAGHYRLTVSSRGRPVGGSPFSVFVSPAEPHAASSTAQGEGLLLARAGEEAKLLLTSYDVHGNRQWHRRLPPGVWRVELQGPATLAAAIAPLPSGRSEARYTPTVAGRYELSVYLAGDHVHGSPFVLEVAPGTIDPRRCVVEGPGTTTTKGTPSPLRLHAPALFLVHASDAWGNRCGSEGARWSARVRQPLTSATSTPQVKLRGTADGACEGTFTPVAKGRHTLVVLLGGQPLSGGEIVREVR